MGKEIESGSNPKDYLGIIWPTQPLTPETVAALVAGSKEKSLRELLAKIIIQEAEELYARYRAMPTHVKNGGRTCVDIAINEGYKEVGKSLLFACKLFNDRGGAVNYYLRVTELVSGETNGKTPNNNLKDSLTELAKKALVSLTIDPTGIDWLNRKLREKEIVWNKLVLNQSGDPEVTGFRKGMERYKILYRQVVSQGAKPDITMGTPFSRLLLKTRRGLDENSFLALLSDILGGLTKKKSLL